MRETIFSPCQKYRYTLWREWDASKRSFANFICLNPSTATATLDDPTIRRCIRFAKDWGYGALCVTNIFAFRATDPKLMKLEADPIGPDNDRWLLRVWADANISVAAWGTHGTHQHRDTAVMCWLRNIHCLAKTAGGHPKHPLYLAAKLKPVPFGDWC